MNTEDISALLSEVGAKYIKQFGAVAYLKNFYRVIGRKLEAKAITETAATVACKRAEAIATCISE